MKNVLLRMPLGWFLLLTIVLRLALVALPVVIQARVDGAPISGRAAAGVPGCVLLILGFEALAVVRGEEDDEDEDDEEAGDPPGR